jgi:hypothetical protein
VCVCVFDRDFQVRMATSVNPFLGRPLEGDEHVSINDVLSLTLPIELLGPVPDKLTISDKSTLAFTMAALLQLVLAVHERNDDDKKLIYLEMIPASHHESRNVDLRESLLKRQLIHLPGLSRDDCDPFFSNHRIVAVRIFCIANRTAYLPTRCIGKAVVDTIDKNAKKQDVRDGADQSIQGQCSRKRSRAGVALTNGREESLTLIRTKDQLNRALAMLALPPPPRHVANDTNYTNADDDLDLERRVQRAFAVDTAVSSSLCDGRSSPEFVCLSNYTINPSGHGVHLTFPRPKMVFVIDNLAQQQKDVFMRTRLPRPVAPHNRFVSRERHDYVFARHGTPPRSLVPLYPSVSGASCRLWVAACAEYYFDTHGGQAYTSLCGPEGTDLLASQAIQNCTMTTLRAENEGKERQDPTRELGQQPVSNKRIKALHRCQPMFRTDFVSHSVASRCAMAELERYVVANKGVLFRPLQNVYTQDNHNLSLVSSWFVKQIANAKQLYRVYRVPMLMRMLLSLFGASDPDISGKISHLALGPHGTGKSYCLEIITEWATPGQVESVAHKSALADTVEGNFDSTVEIWHEANPKLFGIRRRRGQASVSPEESRFKARLTEVYVCVCVWFAFVCICLCLYICVCVCMCVCV